MITDVDPTRRTSDAGSSHALDVPLVEVGRRRDDAVECPVVRLAAASEVTTRACLTDPGVGYGEGGVRDANFDVD